MKRENIKKEKKKRRKEMEITFFVVSSLFIFHPMLIKLFLFLIFIIFNFCLIRLKKIKKKKKSRVMQQKLRFVPQDCREVAEGLG